MLEDAVFPDRVHSLTKRFHVRAGASTGTHVHTGRIEVLTVLDGEGLLRTGSESRPFVRGECASVPAGARHSVHAKTDLHYVSVQIGAEGSEEVLEREG